MRGMPSFESHKTLLAHDAIHGEGRVRFGPRIHWLRSWLVQRSRQWSEFDAVVCGSNPALGALACHSLAREGKTAVWFWPESFDAWDYPLAAGGAHNDLLLAAGLPAMGPRLFEALGEVCAGRVVIARGWTVDYDFPSVDGGLTLYFASHSPSQGSRFGPARKDMERWAKTGFSACPHFKPSLAPRRHGGGPRQQIIGASKAIWVSDRLDGIDRASGDLSPEVDCAIGDPKQDGAPTRLGRARWHAQSPLAFAEESRKDIKIILGSEKAR